MALDVTVAGTAAESYLTVAEADALAGADLGPEAELWLAAGTTDADCENALQRATREIDAYLHSGWPPYVVGQALLFPRAIDYRGTPKVAYIPVAIKRATYEQATYVLRNKRTLDDAATRRARGLQSGSEPQVSWSERPADADAPVISPAAQLYLDGFRRTGGSRGLRSVRMSAGPGATW